jgi:hypothetical protein
MCMYVHPITFSVLEIIYNGNCRLIRTEVPDVLLQLVVLLLAVDTRQVHSMIATILRRSVPVSLQYRQCIRPESSVGCGQ